MGYYAKGVVVTNKSKIIHRYMHYEFYLDVISTIAIILQVSFHDRYSFLVWVPFLFYLKIHYIYQMNKFIEIKLQLMRKGKAAYQIFRLIIEILFICHLFSCLFYGAGCYEVDVRKNSESWLLESSLANNIYELPQSTQYLYAFYWAVTTMLTVGYGDVTAKNPTEVLVSVVTMLFACVIFGILVSTFSGIFADYNKNKTAFETKMYTINRFMRDKRIDDQTQVRVRDFFSFLHAEKIRDEIDANKAITQLGPTLQDDLIAQAYGSFLDDIPSLQPLTAQAKKRLSYKVKEHIYGAGEFIFHIAHHPADPALYFVVNGSVNLVVQLGNTHQGLQFMRLGKGSHFGELSFLTGQPRTISAQCHNITKVYSLRRSDLFQALRDLPSDYQRIFALIESN